MRQKLKDIGYKNWRHYLKLNKWYDKTQLLSYKAFLNFRTNHIEITNAIKKLGLPLNGFLFTDLYCHVGKALLCVEIKKALQDVIDEFGKDAVAFVLQPCSDKLCFNHPTVKQLAYKYVTK